MPLEMLTFVCPQTTSYSSAYCITFKSVAGLFSAAVTALLALSVPNLQPNPKDTSDLQ